MGKVGLFREREGGKYRRKREMGEVTIRVSEKDTRNYTINYLPKKPYNAL
jgi:formylmethanofuran dehydrogenase subunit D